MQHVSRYRPGEDEEMTEYINSQISALIDEHIHNERDRRIMKRRFIDGVCFEPLAEESGLSVQHVKSIVYKDWNKIIKYL